MAYQIHDEVRKNTVPRDILFVHGNLASKNWWLPVLEMAETKYKNSDKQGSMVIADMRGHGRSKNPNPGQMNVEDIVNDFIAVAEKNNLKNVLLVGHSAGGLISSIMLARRPDLFTAGLLVDPVGPTGLKNVPADIEEKYNMMIGNREVAAYVIGLTIHNNDANKEFFKTTIMDDSMMALEDAGVALVKGLMGIDYTAEIAKVKQPVVLFHGTHDWVLDEANATDHQKLMVNSKFVKLPDNGHCMNYENPERLLSEIAAVI